MYFENVMYFSSVEGMEVKSPENFCKLFYKKMRIITLKIVKYHWNKKRFAAFEITIIMSWKVFVHKYDILLLIENLFLLEKLNCKVLVLYNILGKFDVLILLDD